MRTCATEPAARAEHARRPQPEATAEARAEMRAERPTCLERVSLCFLCSLWLDEDEQRCCELCGPPTEEVGP